MLAETISSAIDVAHACAVDVGFLHCACVGFLHAARTTVSIDLHGRAAVKLGTLQLLAVSVTVLEAQT